MSETHRTQVLVVGAGPTGLTTATELARRGVGVRVVERRTAPSDKSKALVVHARTLELLDMIEVADELVAKGYTSPGIDFSASADKPLRADMHKLADETRFPYILILPQAETEAAIERRLNKIGVEVERGRTLTDFQDRGDSIIATIEHEDGGTEHITADYIVGADGPHSTVRETLGIPFEGSPYGWTAFLGDVTLSGHEAEGGTEQHSSDRGLAFIVPFEDGTHRIVTIDAKYQNQGEKRELKLSELQESISSILGKPVELSTPKWLARWGADLKLAARYSQGRALIAGDAAHTHSPAGGQGMNTGIQDAFNLGWKLAKVVNGTAPPSLLDTYGRERHPVGERILRTSDLLLRSLMLRHPIPRKLREALFGVAIPLRPVQRALAMNLSGLGVHYGVETRETGKRVPDVRFRGSDHSEQRLYERLRDGRWLLIAYIDPAQAHDQAARIAAVLDTAKRHPIEPLVVLQNGIPDQHSFDGAETLVDFRGDLESRLGLQAGDLLLVRPDGYVAAHCSDVDSSALFKAYEAALSPHTPPSVVVRGVDAATTLTQGPGRKRALALGAIFAASGTAKLAGAQPMRDTFNGYDLSPDFMRAVGAWEAGSAAAITARPTRALGAVGVALLCGGAAVTHARAKETGKMLNALALLGVAASVLWSTGRE